MGFKRKEYRLRSNKERGTNVVQTVAQMSRKPWCENDENMARTWRKCRAIVA